MKLKNLPFTSLWITMVFSMGLFISIPAAFGQQFVLKAGHIASPLSTRQKAGVKFAELVHERTQGKVRVDVYPAEQLGGGPAQMEALSMGVQDITFEAVAWYSRFAKDFDYYNVPFAFNSFQELYQAYESDIGSAMFDDVRKRVGIRCLAYKFEQSLRSLYSVKKAIRTPEDLKGVKMRVPGIKVYVDAWRILGANTIQVAWGELYTALSQGLVEASEGPLTDNYNSKFFDIEKYITLLNYKPSTGTVSISEKTWKKLPADIQKVIEESAKESADFFTQIEKAEVDKVIGELKKRKDIVFVDYDAQSFIQKASGLAPALEKEGLWSKGLHEKMQGVLGRK